MNFHVRFHLLPVLVCCLTTVIAVIRVASADQPLERIRVSEDRTYFVRGAADERFVVWGVNYDHDADGRLLEEYWDVEWSTVVEDFSEIRSLGANCVRIHLQFGVFMDKPDQPNPQAIDQLKKLLRLAEQSGLYLDITGLACYHKQHIPAWYDALSEPDRWKSQAVFWRAVAKACQPSPAVFCYDLMNEPVLPGESPETDWLLGELGGKFFVQRIALDVGDRTREEIAESWVRQMTEAIRDQDTEHLVTVGVIPWVHVFGAGKPLFHSAQVGKPLDFIAVHFYPEKGEVSKAIEALRVYEQGKPLVVEEMFPLKCSQDELVEFIEKSSAFTDGWISFYWGQTAEQLRNTDPKNIAHALTASWLDCFEQHSQSRESQIP
ncbi:cellulase family glycosylhydrolase [Novipirellula artificiosorum]|uniref:Cellulase (Glycosyl hydrolase family 5) n=1 Tax=Novipirellula artificiosorum TaxID=2528016 RepID=A0A5C6DZ81_9BACT|nr:cellulase family glycosylhydrolase [Novipirellula artificiosorum]TWU41960.1 Cellulase (glycosyl hydrolase family 5) [Novipirellula artificiosorum]